MGQEGSARIPTRERRLSGTRIRPCRRHQRPPARQSRVIRRNLYCEKVDDAPTVVAEVPPGSRHGMMAEGKSLRRARGSESSPATIGLGRPFTKTDYMRFYKNTSEVPCSESRKDAGRASRLAPRHLRRYPAGGGPAPKPRDLPLSRQDISLLPASETAAPGPSRPPSRRSGRIPALPYPPPGSHSISDETSEDMNTL